MKVEINVRRKTFQQISDQCEKIFTLSVMGYGTKRMLEICETIFFNALKENGGY